MDWVSVKEELPTNFCSYYLISNGEYVKQSEFGYRKGVPYFNDGTGIVDDVTHWMYFPDPPKKHHGDEK